jgi:hypothetical protein
MISVRAVSKDDGVATRSNLYKAWKTGHLGLVGYGATLNDAIAAMLNKWGE